MNCENASMGMKSKKRQLILMMILGLLVLRPMTVCSENSGLKVNHSNMLSMLKRANAEYENARFSIAAKNYEGYLNVDTTYPKDVLAKLADCYWQTRSGDNALRVYKLLFQKGKEDATEEQKVRIGELYARHGMYRQAAYWLQEVNDYKAKAEVYNSRLRLELLKKDSLSWLVGFLNINSPYRDYSPVLVDSVLFFSSNRPLSIKKQVSLWDEFCYTRLRKVSLNKIKSEPINSVKRNKTLAKAKTEVVTSKSLVGLYEGADAKDTETELYFMTDKRYMQDRNEDTLSSVVKGLDKIDFNVTGIAFDHNSHVYFSANYQKNNSRVNRVRLMEGIYSSNKITNVHALPFGEHGLYSVMLPAVSKDGNILVFCSDKPGGKGKVDLYYALRDTKTQQWGALKTFNGNLNTVGNEVFPSVTPNGYLYFSSDARPGLGGLDIYRILLQDAIEGKGEPEHLSYPVNSSADDFGWTEDSTATKGFFSSDRMNNNDDNLYSFYYRKYQRMRYVSGETVEIKTNEPVAGATVFMWNKKTNKVDIAKTNKNGQYHFIVGLTDHIILKALKKGMTNDCLGDRSFDLSQEEDTVLKNVQDLLLEKRVENNNLRVGFNNRTHPTDRIPGVMQNLILKKYVFNINDSWKLNSIHYDFNKWNIRADAEPILDSLVTLLRIYPIRVELSSHTDSRGTFEYNDSLSQKRAESVVAYLVKHGVNRNRLIAIGYGKRFLLNRCVTGVPCSEKEHQVNRRTEVRVISNEDIQKDDIDLNQFRDGEQIDKSVLPADFFDNCDKSDLSEDSISSLESKDNKDNKLNSNLNLKCRFPIQFAAGEFNIKPKYHYMLNGLVRVLFKNPLITFQITAQGDANDHSATLSDMRANSIRKYLISKGISISRCQINQSQESLSEVSIGSAVISGNNVNLDNLLLKNFIQSYKGDTKDIIIRHDKGNYCVQLGVFRTKEKSQILADKIQSAISVPVFVIKEDSYFKIRTSYSTNKNDAIEIAAIIQATGVLFGE